MMTIEFEDEECNEVCVTAMDTTGLFDDVSAIIGNKENPHCVIRQYDEVLEEYSVIPLSYVQLQMLSQSLNLTLGTYIVKPSESATIKLKEVKW